MRPQRGDERLGLRQRGNFSGQRPGGKAHRFGQLLQERCGGAEIAPPDRRFKPGGHGFGGVALDLPGRPQCQERLGPFDRVPGPVAGGRLRAAGKDGGHRCGKAAGQIIRAGKAGARGRVDRGGDRQVGEDGPEALELGRVGTARGEGRLEPRNHQRQLDRRAEFGRADRKVLGRNGGLGRAQIGSEAVDGGIGRGKFLVDPGHARGQLREALFHRHQVLRQRPGVGRGGAGANGLDPAFERAQLLFDAGEVDGDGRRDRPTQLFERVAHIGEAGVELGDRGVEADLGVHGGFFDGGEALFQAGEAFRLPGERGRGIFETRRAGGQGDP